MSGFLVFLPVALVVMCVAVYKLCRDGSRVRSVPERHAVARTGCRVAASSSLLLAVAGFGGIQGPAWMIGWLMILLGVGGALTGYVVIRLYPARSAQTPSTQQPLRWPSR